MFIGIPIGMDPAPFWAYLFLYFFEMQYVKNNFSCITKSTQISYPGTVKFIDELCAIIMVMNYSNFRTYIPRNLNWEWSIQEDMPLFLTLTSLSKIRLLYVSTLTKYRLPFFIERMWKFSRNILNSIFYGSFYSDLLRIARCTLLFSAFKPNDVK